MSCGNGRYATTVERPGDPTCALHQLDLLLAFMASNELDIQPGTKLFAQFHIVGGNCVIRLTRTEHKRACQHSFPADLQPGAKGPPDPDGWGAPYARWDSPVSDPGSLSRL